ncbi:aldehyde dehydrogenase family protein [Conexibacter sp. JD483]|uniref:aldehyde dehydrogenase family protein n=1 Tax=unclassified Conexibacter TaxID=2627773 RepID=UPI0027274577|nr:MULTISPECIES: aldehyde dehydrogenase family protein [unclassified Conexibacter]MDO8187322.1 aldehyde dehydrogenase family protein [Conexibacter sp. CPCC 205706]MDO8200545.1 aldehyde dehydrogenase family protein [Conexibacter sp. CPCC 205762]MDR9369986.1 aldehyde dehydrogenase family protein [Conexibacter sp. JD483]
MTASDPTVRGVLIGGEWRHGGGELLERFNPARPSEAVVRLQGATAAEVREAYDAAAAAAPGWRRTPGPARGEILFRAAALLFARVDSLGAELSREEGKTLAEGRGEVTRAAQILRWFAGEASQPVGDVLPSAGATTFLWSERVPLGVVSVITPWNFPVAIPVWKIAPALAFGNTVVWKPSELTPLCAIRVAEVLHEAGLPAGVLNLVHGLPAAIGDAVTGDERIAALTFTGSTGTGRAIQQAVVGRGVKVQLELGGKNPVIVLDDADLDQAVEQTLRGAMWSTGQKCTATSRALVLPGIREAFTARLAERAAALRVGDPLAEGTQIGPVVSQPQQQKVLGYLDIASDEGHELLAGGRAGQPAGDGWFVAPTVYGGVDPASRLGQEEVFGPVVGIIPVDSLEQAVEVANGTPYGLSASIFTRDVARAFAFVREVEAGMVHVNSETAGAEPQAPFGGTKDSSSGSREQGKAAVSFFTETKTVYLDMPPA